MPNDRFCRSRLASEAAWSTWMHALSYNLMCYFNHAMRHDWNVCRILRSMRLMPNDRFWLSRFAINTANVWWSTLTHPLYKQRSRCLMIDADARILRSMLPMPNDRFWRWRFPINAADTWWSTLTNALHDQRSRCLMIDMDARILQLMWLMPNDWHWRMHFTINVTDAWWSTPTQALYDQFGMTHNITQHNSL